MTDEDFVDRWVRRLPDEVPDAVGILLGGSRVRGDAGPHSDVILVPDGPRNEWPSWFDGDVCVSTWIRDIDAWLAVRQEPQD
jgi:hypothetical protein